MTSELNFPSSPSAYEYFYGPDRVWWWDPTTGRWEIVGYNLNYIFSKGYEGDPSKPFTSLFMTNSGSPGSLQAGFFQFQTRYVPAGSPSAVELAAVTFDVTGVSLAITGSSRKQRFYGDYFQSAMATGTAPVQVTSTTLCTNLNADYLDGYHAAETNTVSTVAVRTVNGYLLASYFNMSGVQDNYDADSYCYTQGSDGYIRRKSLANVKSELMPTGTYTATVTGVTNVTGVTSYTAQYVDLGTCVLVSGRADVNATGAGATSITIACPGGSQAPSFSAYEEAGGSWIESGGTNCGTILGNTGSASTVTCSWNVSAGGNKAYGFSFFYRK